jgi:putative hemolysin
MEIFILVILILVNGIFAMSEIALVTARKARLQKRVDEGDKGALAALQLGEDPTIFLSTVQIGITAIGILSGIVGELALAEPLAVWLEALGLPPDYSFLGATALVVVLITYFAIVVGELVPKRIGQTHPETLARLVARPIDRLARLSKPFVLLLSFSTRLVLRLLGVKEGTASPMTEEEIHAVLAEGTSAGVIESQEHTMVRNLFRLDDRQLSTLMVPRSDVVVLDLEESFATNLARVETSDFAYFPVVRGDWSELVGILKARQWLFNALHGEQRDLENQTLAEPLFVPETITGMDLLDKFRQSEMRMACVVDEYGEVMGIVTLQDLIEAITGELSPSDPETSWAVQREDGSWLLDGHIPVPELKDYLGLQRVPDEERGRYHTLSGMMMLLTGRLPAVADVVTWEGWRLEIVDLDGRTIDKVMASRITPEEAENDAPVQTG